MFFDQLTVIITCFRSDKKIYRCLNSLNNQCKVIIIENSKDIDLKKKIEKDFTNVEFFISDNNLGYAKGNNLGLSKVKTKYALIINPDTEVEKNTIKNFFEIIKKLQDFAILAPISENKDLAYKEKILKKVKFVKGFAMFLNLSEFEEIGFFDENFFIYLEEIDLCRRLIIKNKTIYVSSELKITHQGGKSHDEKIDFEMELSRNWHWMWSNFYFNKKHNGFLKALIKIAPKLINSIIKYFYYLIIFKKRKRLIYYQRMSGIFNSMINKNSWYRPKF